MLKLKLEVYVLLRQVFLFIQKVNILIFDFSIQFQHFTGLNFFFNCVLFCSNFKYDLFFSVLNFRTTTTQV